MGVVKSQWLQMHQNIRCLRIKVCRTKICSAHRRPQSHNCGLSLLELPNWTELKSTSRLFLYSVDTVPSFYGSHLDEFYFCIANIALQFKIAALCSILLGRRCYRIVGLFDCLSVCRLPRSVLWPNGAKQADSGFRSTFRLVLFFIYFRPCLSYPTPKRDVNLGRGNIMEKGHCYLLYISLLKRVQQIQFDPREMLCGATVCTFGTLYRYTVVVHKSSLFQP